MRTALVGLLDLRHDQDDPRLIDSAIRSGASAVGANFWVLMFAIAIASIGLDVNSTAVIIGAMLISPLMGPIVGIGYGAGINDFSLIKLSLRNFAIFVVISLTTSTLYFVLSPLKEAHSELLARTTPTLWDVLIAFFGGAAGIVAITRKEISNVIPGVAIATALMPPLCTAGYGLANNDMTFFVGAFYLFSINSVFIAFATLLFVKILKLPEKEQVNQAIRRRTRLLIACTVVSMLAPSAYLGFRLVENALFTKAALQLARNMDNDSRFILLSKDIRSAQREVVFTIGGDSPPKTIEEEARAYFMANNIADAKVKIRFSGAEKIDMALLKSELQNDVYGNAVKQLEEARLKIFSLQEENRKYISSTKKREETIREILAQYPLAKKIALAEGVRASDDKDVLEHVVVVHVDTPLSEIEQERLTAWMQVKWENRAIELIAPIPSATEKPASSQRRKR